MARRTPDPMSGRSQDTRIKARQFRLGDETEARLKRIAEHWGGQSDAQVVRVAIAELHDRVFSAPSGTPEKNPRKTRKTT